MKTLREMMDLIESAQTVDEAKVKANWQLKLVDKREEEYPDDIAYEYEFEVYRDGQYYGRAEGDTYYGELMIDPEWGVDWKLSAFHDKNHPLMQQFEKIQDQGVTEAEDDKVRALNDAEYHHMSLLAKEAGITLGGLGADKITGDLYWSGTTRDGRNVNGVVKRTVSDADLDREEGVTETREEELDRKFNTPDQLKRDADYRAYRAGVKQSRKEQPKPLEETTQEYTVRVVDEENSGYTVKVQAESEQQALHKAIVKVRNQYDAYPEHARIIRQDVEEEASPEAIARIEQLSTNK